ncbi:hypothetical protein INT45_000230 [Circinella minor]|uniref:Uncharacterized protein n=1 Tax=Circinella minor TaxID=1195481 RepID=A0A8H7S2W0_9FUNG|nr:hypothetical protein INT45_000230 [Circinella minor]
MQAYGSVAVRALNVSSRSTQKYMVAAAAYSTTAQIPKQIVNDGNNETLRYLDRLKDSEIEFQSKGEHVSGDFWKTEPGKYTQKPFDVS